MVQKFIMTSYIFKLCEIHRTDRINLTTKFFHVPTKIKNIPLLLSKQTYKIINLLSMYRQVHYLGKYQSDK